MFIMLFGMEQFVEELQCTREIGNAKDRCITCVLQGSDVIGHLPQKISKLTQAVAGISHNTF